MYLLSLPMQPHFPFTRSPIRSFLCVLHTITSQNHYLKAGPDYARTLRLDIAAIGRPRIKPIKILIER